MRITAKTPSTDMKIERKRNLQRLIDCRMNGQIKITTGIRRYGKSFVVPPYDALITSKIHLKYE